MCVLAMLAVPVAMGAAEPTHSPAQAAVCGTGSPAVAVNHSLSPNRQYVTRYLSLSDLG